MKSIIRKNFVIDVLEKKVSELDKTKCSTKFLSHNFPDDYVVFVKCKADGSIDFRGKKQEYRIILPDNNKKQTT